LLCIGKLSFVNWLLLFTAPIVAPNFTVEDTSADSILVKWEDIPVEELRGFLRGYLFYFQKGERDTTKMQGLDSGE
jgi:leukemia inhibitory factor receptor